MNATSTGVAVPAPASENSAANAALQRYRDRALAEDDPVKSVLGLFGAKLMQLAFDYLPIIDKQILSADQGSDTAEQVDSRMRVFLRLAGLIPRYMDLQRYEPREEGWKKLAAIAAVAEVGDVPKPEEAAKPAEHAAPATPRAEDSAAKAKSLPFDTHWRPPHPALSALSSLDDPEPSIFASDIPICRPRRAR